MTLLTFDGSPDIPASLLDASVDPIGIHIDGRWAFLNRAFVRLLGDPPVASMIGTRALEIVPEDERAEVLEARDRVHAGRAPQLVEHSVLRRDGSRVRVQGTASMLELEGRRAFLVVLREISERDRFVAQLARSEARFKAVVEQAGEAVVVLRDDIILYANPAALRMVGHSDLDAILGKNVYESFLPPEDHVALRAARALHDRGELPSVSARWIRTDGSLISVDGTRKKIVWDGEPAYLVVARDVTEQLRAREEQRRAEEALRASEARYRTLFEASPQPVFLVEIDDTRFLAVNEAAVRLYGYTREEFLSMRLVDLKDPSDVPELIAGLEMVKGLPQAHTPLHGLRRHRTKSGHVLDVDICVHGLTIDGHRTLLAVCTDVTEQRRLEEQLRQSQKMEAVGRLAGGIAHDFNNILAVILGCADVGARKLQGTAAAAEVNEIRAASMRAAGLTRQLLSFTRNQPTHASVFELDSVLAEFRTMLSRVIGEHIEMKTTLGAPLGMIEADRAQIEQLILNLVINARDAMPSGGDVAIATSIDGLSAADAKAVGLSPGRYVTLTVKDRGCGMDEATRARMFEPFFTTKAAGKGTGLGLSMVFAIVQRFGGGIACTSAVGVGSTFKVYFPCVDTARVEARVELVPHVSVPATETLLVVEDDHQVRSLLTRVLAAENYKVLTAPNAEAALELLHARGSEIDLMLTDLVMPGLSGDALAARVRRSHPGVRVVYMSGYADERTVELDPSDEAPFLQKPFATGELLAAIRSALGARRFAQQPL